MAKKDSEKYPDRHVSDVFTQKSSAHTPLIQSFELILRFSLILLSNKNRGWSREVLTKNRVEIKSNVEKYGEIHRRRDAIS